MPYPHWTQEERRKYNLTPYLTLDGKMVWEHLAWTGYCSLCKENVGLTAGIAGPSIVLLQGGKVTVVENSFDSHDCGVYDIGRELNSFDMAHPINGRKKFVPTSAQELYYDIFGK